MIIIIASLAQKVKNKNKKNKDIIIIAAGFAASPVIGHHPTSPAAPTQPSARPARRTSDGRLEASVHLPCTSLCRFDLPRGDKVKGRRRKRKKKIKKKNKKTYF